jgi:outer membrane protein
MRRTEPESFCGPRVSKRGVKSWIVLVLTGVVFAVRAAGAPDAPARTVTLEEAILQARAGNARLQAAREDVRLKEGELEEARSYLIPDLTLTENVSRTNNPVYVFMGKLTQSNFQMSDFSLPVLNDPAPLTNFQSKADLTLPLFTGGKLRAGYRAARKGVEAAQSTSAFAESSVVQAVTESFYGSLLALRAVGVMRDTVKTAQAHLARVEAMHKQGLVLDSDLLRMRVFVADMRQKEASREVDSQVARAYLAYAMGIDGDVDPRGDFEPPAAPLPALEDVEEAGLKNRGDLHAVRLQALQAGDGIAMARADYLPQVGASASYEEDTEKWTPGTRGNNWTLGIQLKLPLFDGGARAGRLQAARSRQIQAQKALLDREQKVKVEIRSAWLRARAAAQRVAVTGDSEAQARENQRIVALRYKEGLAGITELLDADTALTASSLSRAEAIHDELVERARLNWAIGK